MNLDPVLRCLADMERHRDDAHLVALDDSLQFFLLEILEQDEDGGGGEEWFSFYCFAENREHAVEQAKNAYPGCIVIV